ncbi:hypothetical protein ACHAWF_012996 [Thalassiosira exigua]
MNARQPHDDRHNEQVAPKRRKSLYNDKARPPPSSSSRPSRPSLGAADVAILNNLGVDCFEHGVLPDASKCFRNAMSIFAPALPRSLCREALGEDRGRSDDRSSAELELPASLGDDHEEPLIRARSGSSSSRPLSPLAPAAAPAEADDNAPPSSASSAAAAAVPRTEYDEGMNTYGRPIRIESSYTSDEPDAVFDPGSEGYRRAAPVLLFNVAQLHVRAGDDVAAANYFLYALDIVNQRRTDGGDGGDDSPPSKGPILDASPVLHNLGHVYYRAQNYKLAAGMYARALECAAERRRTAGGDVAEDRSARAAAAGALNCLGVLHFHAAGSSDESASRALEMFGRCLELRRGLLAEAEARVDPAAGGDRGEGCGGGADDGVRREIATTMNNVGRVHYMLGDHAAALATYVEAYALRKELLSEDHLDRAASAYNLGQTHHQLGNLDEAMELYQEFRRIVSKYLGPSHRDVAIILKCMAQVHHDRSQYEEAARLYYESLATTKAALGDLHPEVASTLNKIGNMHYENSDFDAAVRVYEEGLAVERAVLRGEHQNIVVTLTNIAQSHKHRGDHAAALEKYREAYELQRRALGRADPKVAAALSNVAQVSCRLGEFARALDAYQEVLRIRRDAHGDEHVDVAATLNSIGLVLFRQGYHALAVESFEESLRVRRVCLGDRHRDVAVVLYNIATTRLEQGDEDGAMACYAETLRVERAVLGDDHRDLVVTLQHIGQVFRHRGELDVALDYLDEVLRIERLNGGEKSVTVARVLNKMGNLHLQRADVPNMMICFSEATRIFEAAGLSVADETGRADGEETSGELKITGYNFYSLSKFHPECAGAA